MSRLHVVSVLGASAIAVAAAASISCGQPPAESTSAAAAAQSPAPSDAAIREFIRVNLDKAEWHTTEGNKLGVQTAVLEGDPSKPGFYLTVNRFPPGVMSRPHFHGEERHCLVIKGTWYTQTSDVFTADGAVGLKPGDYMRHPAGGHHFDGALDEEVLVAISGYGPSSTTVVDGGELFGRVEKGK